MPSWGAIGEEINEAKESVGADAYDVVRRFYLGKLAEERGNDVILYSSGWTHQNLANENQSIRDSDIHGFMETLSGLNGDSLDLIIHSPGGLPEAAEQIVEYLRSKYSSITVFVPQAAKSASTLICCAADEVWMGSHSCVGPIDPQITLETDLGVRMVPANSILDQFDKAREEYEERGQIGHWAPILSQYGPSLLKECEDANKYAEQLAEKWARKYMLSDVDDGAAKAEELASHLAERDKHNSHNRPIMRDEAEEIGFVVRELEQDQRLQDLVLSVFHAASHTHSGAGIVKIIENHNDDAYMQLGARPKNNQADEENGDDETRVTENDA